MAASQANIQGVFNERVDHLNEYRRIMGDIILDHHLISQDAEIQLFDRSFDIHGDISSVAPFVPPVESAPDDETQETNNEGSEEGDLNEPEVPTPPAPFIKKVLFDKAPNLNYVQETFDNWLVENSEQYPYLVQITMTDMPRHLNLGDRLKLGETIYEVRLVTPISRLNDSIQRVMVCPLLFNDVPEKETVDLPFIPEENPTYKKSKIL